MLMSLMYKQFSNVVYFPIRLVFLVFPCLSGKKANEKRKIETRTQIGVYAVEPHHTIYKMTQPPLCERHTITQALITPKEKKKKEETELRTNAFVKTASDACICSHKQQIVNCEWWTVNMHVMRSSSM